MSTRLGVLLITLSAAACTSQNGGLTTCSELTPCSGGRGYQFCSTGTIGGCAVGRYVQSDGQTLGCASCDDCKAVAAQEALWCAGTAPMDLGLACRPSPVSIPKSGPRYMGIRAGLGITDAAQCPDWDVEPNDGLDCALAFALQPDQPSPTIMKVAICPDLDVPGGPHDVDFYKVDNLTGPASLWLTAELFYDIAVGDLDIAIYNDSLQLLAADGTEVSNGCAAAQLGWGVYYVAVAGAANADSGNYQLRINSYTTPHTCP